MSIDKCPCESCIVLKKIRLRTIMSLIIAFPFLTSLTSWFVIGHLGGSLDVQIAVSGTSLFILGGGILLEKIRRSNYFS